LGKISYKCPIFSTPGKKDINNGASFGKSHIKRGTPGGENHLDSIAFNVHLTGCIPTLFWQSNRDLNVFSTRTEKGSFTGFSVFDRIIWMENRARIGRIYH